MGAVEKHKMTILCALLWGSNQERFSENMGESGEADRQPQAGQVSNEATDFGLRLF